MPHSFPPRATAVRIWRAFAVEFLARRGGTRAARLARLLRRPSFISLINHALITNVAALTSHSAIATPCRGKEIKTKARPIRAMT